ncbi:MAG TPA: hypothetical protein VF573_29460 [Paraburkholderia sp.]|uniref:hypothetical protein n=1 Tax=Paraburkholderia sp. TaxID=1926495 RepID=UPI002ED5C11B
MPPEIVTIQFGADGNAAAEAQDFKAMRHPSGIYTYTMHWDDARKRGAVRYMQGNHSFEINNVSIVTGLGDKDSPERGVDNWHILFNIAPKKSTSHREARDRTMALLGQLRAAGWKRYIRTAEPRLSGKEAAIYGLSESGVIYSLDSTYTPTVDEWIKLINNDPQWIFYADGAFVELSISYQDSGVKDQGYYLMDILVNTASDKYSVYFSDAPEKMKAWQKYLPNALQRGKQERLKKEAGLKAQGFTIDTTYQDPPFEVTKSSPGTTH